MSEKKKGDCEACGGEGFWLEHDHWDTHIDGQCTTCPIQIPCGACYGTGYEPFVRELFIEKEIKKFTYTWGDEDLGFDIEDDLPF
jgi:hypothetical protein